MRPILGLLAAAAATLTIAAPARAATIQVDTTRDIGGPCNTDGCGIRQALATAEQSPGRTRSSCRPATTS